MKSLSTLFALVALLAWGSLTAHACTTNADCDDGNVCNGVEFCQAGLCFSPPPLTCDDGDACTTNSCDPVLGCQYSSAGGCMIGGDGLTLSNYGALRVRLRTSGGYGGGAFPAPFSANDPVLHGGSMRVYSTNGDTFDATYPLPASNWSYIGLPEAGRGYIYRDLQGAYGPIHHFALRNGKASNLHGAGAALAFSLHTDPRPVNVVLRYGDLLDCLSYGGGNSQTKFLADKRYGVKHAAPPPTCP